MESYEISSPPHDPPFSAPGSPPPSDDTHLSANDALLADDIRGKIIKQVIFGVLFPMCWLWILDCRTLDSAFGVWGWLHLSGPLTRITSTNIVGIENQARTKVGEPSGAEDRLWVDMHVIKLPRFLQLLLHLQQAHWLGL
ncbi:hypothetical protein CK203_018295 [Vitis vinifera]|uniref:Uncharacterized protein n=1 Tax=Vitis vinifera TaxID=29760 RepID=A0A438JP84_VITVI|nr:hypothetical protein CK203_018295 [Vitis vinifera]